MRVGIGIDWGAGELEKASGERRKLPRHFLGVVAQGAMGQGAGTGLLDLFKRAVRRAQRSQVARAYERFGRELDRRLRQTDQRLVTQHLRGETRKLHIGCGTNLLAGWLNADCMPISREVLHLNAGKPFTILPDASFDYVFSEHMIEHVSYASGQSMLRECHRILRPGGRIRISTPDLAFLVDLYRNDPSELQARYIQWSAQQYPPVLVAEPSFVINNFVRDWGHQFIYDEKTLEASLKRAGFSTPTRCMLQQSVALALRQLENDRRMPPSFLQLETLTLECEKDAVEDRTCS